MFHQINTVFYPRKSSSQSIKNIHLRLCIVFLGHHIFTPRKRKDFISCFLSCSTRLLSERNRSRALYLKEIDLQMLSSPVKCSKKKKKKRFIILTHKFLSKLLETILWSGILTMKYAIEFFRMFYFWIIGYLRLGWHNAS